VTEEGPFELVLTPPAVRAVQSSLPESVAPAVIEFLTGALVDNPSWSSFEQSTRGTTFRKR
jgi:hypothetical protein